MLGSPRTKVEVKGAEARHYDLMMDIIMLGRYQHFMEKAIAAMDIQPGDAILDLGSGTGRNTCMMEKYAGANGRLVGLDIGQEMMAQARERCGSLPHVELMFQRIEEPLPFTEEFDHAFISFVLHGFEDEDKEKIIANVQKALKPGGVFWILDYNEFDLSRKPFYVKFAFTKVECPLAAEFVALNLREMLGRHGFGAFQEKLFAWKYVRLLGARKLPAGNSGGTFGG